MSKIENVIYIITNPSHPGYVKIGYASDLKARIATLNTGLLRDFVPYAVYETPVARADTEVRDLITLINPILHAEKNSNHSSNEFYRLEAEEAYAMLGHIAKMTGTADRLYKVDSQYNKIMSNTSTPSVPTIMIPTISDKQLLPNGIYTLSRKVKRFNNQIVNATLQVENGKYILKAGSMICPIDGKGLQSSIATIRKTLPMNGYILATDTEMLSMNQAGSVVLGGPLDGWMNWKDKDGNLIDKYRS